MKQSWEPACDITYLRTRAQVMSKIRRFFADRSVLEVETPLLCSATGTDPQLDFFSSYFHSQPDNMEMFLQTSPEFAMKRLLAAGSGSIYQICKAFRNGELGRYHNPEFTILEWYRIDFNLNQLMEETADLIVELLGIPTESISRISYKELFEKVTGLNPLFFNQKEYAEYAANNKIKDAILLCEDDHAMWLDFIFSYKVQPTLKEQSLCMVFGYPAIQSSLARINQNDSRVADRFEVFIKGIEVGNGFFELADAVEQERRFDQENSSRQVKKLRTINKDEKFLDALRHGLPDCSGIALGIDRLLMSIADVNSLNDVMAFPFNRA